MPASQPILNPVEHISLDAVRPELFQEPRVRYLVKGFGKVQVHHVHGVAGVLLQGEPFQKFEKVGRAGPVLHETMLGIVNQGVGH